MRPLVGIEPLSYAFLLFSTFNFATSSKESPPYLHDGRCLTLEDSVEFFNLVLGTKLTSEEKKDLVAFMRQL